MGLKNNNPFKVSHVWLFTVNITLWVANWEVLFKVSKPDVSYIIHLGSTNLSHLGSS